MGQAGAGEWSRKRAWTEGSHNQVQGTALPLCFFVPSRLRRLMLGRRPSIGLRTAMRLQPSHGVAWRVGVAAEVTRCGDFVCYAFLLRACEAIPSWLSTERVSGQVREK